MNASSPTPELPETESPAPSGDVEKQLQFNDQTNYIPPRKIITIFLACATVDAVALLDQTTLAASLYIISSALSAGPQTSWIANAHFVTSTSCQLLYGRLSDIWSRKSVLLFGLFIMFTGSLWAGESQTAGSLIAARAWTGIGAGGVATVAQIIVGDVVSLRERGKYQGILGVVVALANGLGPVIGGAIASKSGNSWRWIFRMNLPLTVGSALSVVFAMPLRKVEGSWKRKLKAVDFFGAALTLAGSALFILGLNWGGVTYPWTHPAVLTPLILGPLTLAFFIYHQHALSPLPIMPTHIFRSPLLCCALLTTFLNGWGFFGQIFYIPTFYQMAYSYSATRSGLLLLPLLMTQALMSTLSGLAVTYTGRYRESLILGWAAWTAGLALFSTLTEESYLPAQIGYAILTGAGVGCTLQPSLIAIQAAAQREDMAVVTAVRNFVRNLAGMLAVCVSGVLVNASLRMELGEDAEFAEVMLEPVAFAGREEVRRGYARGFRWVFWVNAGLAGLGLLVTVVGMRQVGLDRGDEEGLKKEAVERLEKGKEMGGEMKAENAGSAADDKS